MAGSAGPGVLYGEVSAGWTPDTPVALVLFHGYGANERDLAPLGPMLAPALPWAALRAPLGVAPGGYAWFPPVALGDRDPARATDAAWQWIDAHMAPDATVAAVGFSQGGLMATQLLRTRPERVAATVVLSGFVQAAPQPADEQLAAERPAVFWGRGARDPMIPADAIEGTRQWLTAHCTLTERVWVSGLPATRSARDRLAAVPGRWPGQVIAMAFGAIPTVIGGPAVLVAVRIGVTESVPPVT